MWLLIHNIIRNSSCKNQYSVSTLLSFKVAQMSEAKFPKYTNNIQSKAWKKNKEIKIWVTSST